MFLLAALALFPLARAQVGPTGAPSAAAGTSYTIYSTNPSAVPVASLISNAPVEPTPTLDTTYAPGATPPITGAPPLPNWTFTPGSFPTLDQTPPTNSSQVQQWIAEVAASGASIPNISPTNANGCSNNTAAVAAASQNGWWTCGGYTRTTDITTCADPKSWGFSSDDGPSPYTPGLIDYLDSQKIKGTFFVIGSRAISYPTTLQAEYMGGHQICVHTWSHPYMTTLTNDQIIAELGWTKLAIKQITGVTPLCWRPPYGDVDDRVRAIATAMDLTTIIWTSTVKGDFDTNDWYIPAGTVSVQQVLASLDSIFTQGLSLSTGFILLEHDLYQQTVDLAVGYTLPSALALGFNIQPIISCLHQPLANSYIETNNNSTNPPGKGGLTLQPSGTGAGSAGGSATGSGPTKTGSVKSSSAPPSFSWAGIGSTGLVGAVGAGVALLNIF
ncbi:carbohydrate esterase family 4 protein [Botryobasidium botryosum FD-172 SS1]|uniref:chitin deacetylase n=1 Tax=Botryobasidium botryosum (strain FD-172 SS1) TaxID=930990 RepID=A0A067MFY2_BOTB1|nr:carbohydrate esterase family 4 protein [Botryobasidium botryosum FD-172 SS1]